MSVMEIALLVAGAAIFIVSFLIPEGKQGGRSSKAEREAIRRIVDDSIADANEKINGMVDESVQYAVEKSERSLERVSNEKIMAVSEYSDSVISAIEKNHQEVMFLYDMLNDKTVDLKNTVREAQQVEKDTRAAIEEAQSVQPSMAAQPAAVVQSAAFAQPSPSVHAAAFAQPSETSYSLGDSAQPVSAIERLLAGNMTRERELEQAEESQFAQLVPAERISVSDDGDVSVSPYVPDSRTEDKKPASDSSKGKKKSTSAGKAAPTRKAPAKQIRGAKATAAAKKMDISLNSAGGGRNKNEKILELHRQGKSNVEVARELGLGTGEVKLVIDLFEGTK